MKALSQTELANVVDTTKVLVGARLQEVITAPQTVALAFWNRGHLLWIYIDLSTHRPLLLPFSESSFSLPAKKSPLYLFLKAHFLGKILRNVELKQDLGRVVVFQFGPGFELELRLFPHGQNIIAVAGDKKISWDIVKPLNAQEISQDRGEPRDLNTLRNEWLLSTWGSSGKSKAKGSPVQATIEKREKALEKVHQEIAKKRELAWRQVADWIVQNQSLEVPAEWNSYVDRRRKLAWNVEQCYERAKENEKKINGTLERARKLELEIETFKTKLDSGLQTLEAPEVVNPLKVVQAEGRSLRLSPDISVVAGKSATDNMKLLKKARAWDYWVHIKDHPSSHAIVFRNKKSELSQAEWHQVAQWFLKMSFGSKAKSERMQGEKFDLLIAECRFVTSIKGDRLGRVTYRNERVMPVRFHP